MPAITLKIGARLDSNASHVFDALIAASQRASKTIAANGKAAAKEYAGGYRDAPAHLKKGFDDGATAADGASKKIIAASKRAAKEQERDAEHVFQIKQRFLAQEARVAARLAAENQRTFAKGRKDEEAHQAAAQKERAGIISRGFGGAVGAARGALGVAGDFARGAGVSFDLAGSVGRGVSLHSQAADIVNQLRLNGQNPAPGEEDRLVGLSRKVADEKAYGSNDVMGVLASFQGKSSDLDTGKSVLGDLAELAKATGTAFTDMGDAAGTVNSQLAEGPDRAKQLMAIMRLVTAQTAAGSVEMKDFATQMPKLAGAANAFSGTYEENLGQLTALAQMSIKGGASSASDAATSAGNISRDMRKRETLKAWGQEGMTTIDAKSGNVKSPETLILEALRHTNGDAVGMGKLFANASSGRAAEAARQTYNKAGKGSAGEAAVKAEFDKFKQTVSADQVKEMAASKLDDTGAKVQRFNNALDKIADDTAARVLPALQKLAPTLVDVADGLGKMAGYVAENPGKSLVIALTASLVKEMAAANLKGLLQGAIGGKGGSIIAGLTIAAATATIITETMNKETEKGEVAAGSEVDAHDATIVKAAKELKKTGKLSPETMADLATAKAEIGAEKEKGASADKGRLERMSEWAFGGKSLKDLGAENEYKANSGRIASQEKDIKAILDAASTGAIGKAVASALQNGTIKVHVTNPGGMQPGTTGPSPTRGQ